MLDYDIKTALAFTEVFQVSNWQATAVCFCVCHQLNSWARLGRERDFALKFCEVQALLSFQKLKILDFARIE